MNCKRNLKQKRLLIFILFLSVFIQVFSVTTSKTFMMQSGRGSQFIINESSSFFMRNHIKQQNSENFFILNSLFYEESCSAGGLSNYFMPNGKSELLVQGQGVAALGITDIYAEWLGIVSTGDISTIDDYKFSSRISISPEINRWGINLSVYKKLHKHFWFSMLVPFHKVSTSANLKEFQISGQRPDALKDNEALYYEDPFNAAQALSNPQMKYGKIDNLKHQKGDIADINLKLGISKVYNNKYLLDLYSQILIPTADKPTAEYLFEPIVGNGHHLGLGCGLKFSTNFKDLTILSSIDYLYLMEGTEKRSFDLNNGPWSRYMSATTGLPRTRPDRLINYLTQDLKVTPGSYFNGLFGLDWKKNKFHLQFGTNIEAKSSESLSLKSGWNESVAIAYYADANPQSLVSGDTYDKSYSNAYLDKPMVTDDGVDDSFVSIKSSDLNLDSARVLNFLSVNPYLNLGFEGRFSNNMFNVESGLFYKLNSNNKSIGSVGFWLNLIVQL